MLLSDICEIIMGQSPSSDSYNVKGQGLPFFQGNADFGKLYPSVRLWCNCPIKKAEAGDLLVSVRAPIGAVNLANQKCCIGRGLAALRPYKDKCDAMYLYYLIKAGKNKLNWLGTGSTFKAITRSSLLSFNVPDYCIALQRKISGKLWSVDKLIHQRNEQLKLFNLLIQSRFLELFGELWVNDKGFPCYSVGQVAESVTYGTSAPASNSGQYEYLRMNNLTDNGQLDLSDLKRIDMSDDQAEKYMAKKGDILFNRTNSIDLVGKTALFNLNNPMIIAGYLIRIRLSDKVNPVYFAAYMNMPYMKEKLRNMAKGAVNQANINSKELKSIQILIPPLSLQNEYCNFVLSIDKSKMAIQKSLDELETLKKSLMQTYFG